MIIIMIMDAYYSTMLHTSDDAHNCQGDGHTPLLSPVKCTSKVKEKLLPME